VNATNDSNRPTLGQLWHVPVLVLSLILATSMSWSHIRRRLSGQLDVDDVETG